MPTIEPLAEPAKVAVAVKLLYVVVGIGVIRTAMTVIRHIDVRSPHFLISWKLVVYALSIFLIYHISRGGNWARWSLVFLLAISIPLTILPTFASIAHNPADTLLGFLQVGLYLVALVYLFHPGSSDWFAARKMAEPE